MGRSHTTFQKRQRELQKIRKRQDKAARRRERSQVGNPEREDLVASGIDPDLHGITAGPHNQTALPDDVEIELDGVGGVIIRQKQAASNDG